MVFQTVKRLCRLSFEPKLIGPWSWWVGAIRWDVRPKAFSAWSASSWTWIGRASILFIQLCMMSKTSVIHCLPKTINVQQFQVQSTHLYCASDFSWYSIGTWSLQMICLKVFRRKTLTSILPGWSFLQSRLLVLLLHKTPLQRFQSVSMIE